MEIHTVEREEYVPRNDTKVKDSSNPSLTFQRMFRYITVTLTIFGLYFENTRTEKIYQKVVCLRSYSICMLLFRWVATLWNVVAVARMAISSNIVGVLPITTVVWQTLCVFNATILFYGCHTHISHFRKAWGDLIFTQPLKNFQNVRRTQKTRVYVTIIIVTGWIIFAVNFVGVEVLRSSSYFSQGNGTESVDFLKPSTFTSIALAATNALHTSAWIFPLIFQMMTCLIISHELKAVTEILRFELEKSRTKFPEHFEDIRKHHCRICQQIDRLDNVMSLQIMNACICNIPLACFILYSLIVHSSDMFYLVLKINWLVIAILYVSAVSLSAALIPSGAHSPLEHVYDTNVNNATSAEWRQLKLFVARLNGSTIGFTAMGMVTITKEVILTLASIYLTYFFLLLQFRF